ncbi:MAG: hypothetical protein RL173_1824 [Fibrobacterota bacterium]|jgi:putative glutamine amidotransferase
MKLAITMRTAKDAATGEVRDAIDRAWYRFLAAALPDCTPIPIPNHPESIVAFLGATTIDGLLLTGGDDIGASPERDTTESVILSHCLERGLPVLGVCRGLQFLSHRFGGTIEPCDPALHRATRHQVRVDPANAPKSVRADFEANSYHNLGAVLAVDGPLRAWAWSPDGCVEGVTDPVRRILAIGWHPERESTFREIDIALFREHFHRSAP